MFNVNEHTGGVPYVTLQDRVRRLPEALLFTAGYYASRVPMLSEWIRRLD